MATTPKPRVAKSGRPDSVNNAAGLRITTMNQQPQAAGKSRTEVYEWGKGRQIFEHPRLLMGKRITSISCGGDHAAAITDDGKVYVWGDGRSGQLGLGDSCKKVDEPTLLPLQSRALKVWCGPLQTSVFTESKEFHMCGIDLTGPVYSLRHVDALPASDIYSVAFSPTVIACVIVPVQVAAGFLSLTQVWVWGESRKGLLGLDKQVVVQATPAPIESLHSRNIVHITASETHMSAVTAIGAVYEWGEIASLNGNEVWTPTLVDGLSEAAIVTVSSGFYYTLALDENGALYSWGRGGHGVLGHGNSESCNTPRVILSLNESRIVGIASGGLHSVAWADDGRLFAWGSGRGFKLGFDSEDDVEAPQVITPLAKGKVVLQAVCGFDRTVALLERNIINVHYKKETKSFQMTENLSVQSLLAQVAEHYGVDVSTTLLIDQSGQELSLNSKIRKYQIEGNTEFFVVAKYSLAEEEDESLIFNPASRDQPFPAVRGATIDRLVEWLTFHNNTGSAFTDTFMCTFPTFISHEELLQRLIARYKSAKICGLAERLPGTTQNKSIVRKRVLNAIKKWIAYFPEAFIEPTQQSAQLVEDLWKFIEDEPMQDFPRESSNLRRTLLSLLEGRDSNKNEAWALLDITFPSGVPIPQITPPEHNNPVDLFKYAAIEIARQLTIIDYFEFFRKIQARELLSGAWMKPDKEKRAQGVIQLIRRFNNLSQWVAAEILRGENRTARLARLEKFIDIMDCCVKLNNFQSAMSILAAFNSTPIYRLQSLWDNISEPHREIVTRVRETMSAEKNMSNYRSVFKSLASPKIPFLGIVLQDLTFIEDGNPDYLDADKHLINFERRSQVANLLVPLLRLQLEPYWFCPVHELLLYLMNARGFENHDVAAYNFSKMIEARAGESSDDAIHEAPPLMSDDIGKLYSVQEPDKVQVLLEAQEVKLLNQRAAVMLGDHSSMRSERENLWASWCEKVLSDRLLFVSSSDEQTTGRGRRSTVILSDSEILEQASSSTTSSSTSQMSGQLTFKEILTRSKCVETSIESAILLYPNGQTDEELLRTLLSHCLSRSTDIPKLLSVIKELHRYRPTAAQRAIICAMVSTYKDHSMQLRMLQETLQNIERTRRKAQGRARGAFISGQRQNPQLALFQSSVIEMNLSLELVEHLSKKAHILQHQQQQCQSAYEQMRCPEIAELATFFNDLQTHAQERLHDVEQQQQRIVTESAAQEEQLALELERESTELLRMEGEYQDLLILQEDLESKIAESEANLTRFNSQASDEEQQVQAAIDANIEEAQQNIEAYGSLLQAFTESLSNMHATCCHKASEALAEISEMIQDSTVGLFTLVESYLVAHSEVSSYLRNQLDALLVLSAEERALPNPDEERLVLYAHHYQQLLTYVQEAESNLHLMMEIMMKQNEDTSGTDSVLVDKLATLTRELEALLEVHQQLHQRHAAARPS